MSALSTIIPVLNDDEALRRCLEALQSCTRADENEIIVADGGTSSTAQKLALDHGAKYIASERGRGRQMSRAAALATGEWLWFLHADCVPAAASIEALLSLDAKAVWGCFRHRIDAPSLWLRVIETADNLRARLASMPYGDQGIFVRAKVFSKLGGYDEVPILEDVLLARKLAAITAPRILKPPLLSDARRWVRNGVGRTTLTNWSIVARYFVGQRMLEDFARQYESRK